jgi:hypothetical protein
MNEGLIWRCLKRIIEQNDKLLEAGQVFTDSSRPIIDEILREIEALEAAKHA